jgi:peptide/nickel transport system ATP-binding protein
MCDMRGDRLAMIFQEPMTSLNPVYSIGEQIAETLVRHRGLSRKKARARTIDLLRLVKIPSPEQRVDDYPHRLSGGMRQRAMIALALACDPKLLIADEPTTALDVTIQAQILDLMRDLKAASGAAIILITHDLGVVAEVCDEVAVMYAGEIVERAPVDVLFAAPQHPYTIGLLGSIPRLDWSVDELAAIDGMVPNMAALPRGCRFAPRCPFMREICTHAPPPIVPVGPGHASRCIRAPLGSRPSDRNRDRRGWGELFARGRQNTRARGRIRLWQIDSRPAGAAADRANGRTHPLRRPRCHGPQGA